MAFDTHTRNALARLTADARSLLVEEFTKQMQGVYGIQPSGQISDINSLGHLDDEQRAVAGVLRDRIHHITAGSRQDKKALAEAVDRVIREQAFTILNRFAALRMCEERGIVQQCVGNAVLSKGFQVYLQTAGSGLGEQYERYRTYLFCIFDEIAVDLGILFDRYSPYGLLFPREPALFELLEILNRKDLANVWVEDEAIGWIYQYFNSKEQRQQMRKASAAPRNSRELAVRNQFFTPRYVVEFLSDNTLGRIWHEMRKGDTALKDQCRYMVRRPNEIFMAPGQQSPAEESETEKKELSQEELLKQPVYISHRPLKDPRQIRMLDPACGSMHFGLYCFDLFETIYSEAWDIAKSGSLPDDADASFSDFCRLTADYASKADLMRDVPALIIEHNIHGIDIDPRCAQIAGLSLWLRAQKSWKLQGIKPANRPRITKSNIVCAEPMPGDKELLKAFTSTLNPPLLGQIVEKVWGAMQLAGEAGSLLKIEEQIADWVAEAKAQWKELPRARQMLLFEPRAAYGTETSQGELKLDLTGISDEAFWEQAEERIYAALEDYSNQAAGAGNVAQKLFADDAAKGFAFIDLCRKRYDTVLMNPPFGDWSIQYKAQTKRDYPNSYNDILAAFVERAGLILCAGGRVGAITSRTCFFLSSFSKWRDQVVLGFLNPELLVDLGHGVMDAAMVEAAGYVLSKPIAASIMICIRLLHHDEPVSPLTDAVDALRAGNSAPEIFAVEPDTFRQVPNAPFSYWVNEKVRKIFPATPILEGDNQHVSLGLSTKNDTRFVRVNWEVPPSATGRHKSWANYANGGSFSPFYADVVAVVRARDDFRELREYLIQKFPYLNGNAGWILHDENDYISACIAWPLRTHRFSPALLPAEVVFSARTYVAICPKPDLGWSAGLMASVIVDFLLKLSLGRSGHPEFVTAVVRVLPWVNVDSQARESLAAAAFKAWAKKRSVDSGVLTSHAFCLPVFARELASLTNCAATWSDILKELEREMNGIQAKIDKIAYALYGLSDEDKLVTDLKLSDGASGDFENDDVLEGEYTETITADLPWLSSDLFDYIFGTALGRWDIRYATGERQPPELPNPFDPLPVCPPGMLQNAAGLPAEPKDVPADYLLRISWPGILVDDENHKEDIVSRIEDALKVIWKENWESIEQEACDILEIKKLRDYFAEKKFGSKFFADHLSRYSKSRRQAPIYWPLSTESGAYTLWIYYHRLDDQMLFKCVTDFLEPKIRSVSADIERLQKTLADGGTATERDELDALLDFRIELDSMKMELLRVAHLPYKPDLNDGVIINAAPLWKLFRLKKWQNACKDCWEKLEAGDYDWAHIAFNIWPDRVREKCRTDKSLAIAHDLEDVYEEPPEKPKKRKGKQKPEPEAELNYDN